LLCLRNARAFPLLPAALASVPFGFVLVRVRVLRVTSESRVFSSLTRDSAVCGLGHSGLTGDSGAAGRGHSELTRNSFFSVAVCTCLEQDASRHQAGIINFQVIINTDEISPLMATELI